MLEERNVFYSIINSSKKMHFKGLIVVIVFILSFLNKNVTDSVSSMFVLGLAVLFGNESR